MNISITELILEAKDEEEVRKILAQDSFVSVLAL